MARGERAESIVSLLQSAREGPGPEDKPRHERLLGRAVPVYLPVVGGQVRSLRFPGPLGSGARPVLFVPGWGTTPWGFLDVIHEIASHGELIYLETREKLSSRMDASAPFDMDAMAGDVDAAVSHFRLRDRQGVLLATCWGSSVVLHARATGLCGLPTIVCHDPMHRIWAPRWLLRFGAPLLPWWLLALLRPLIKPFVLQGMNGPVQRRRTAQFIDGADAWKWRRAAISVRDWSLYPLLSSVPDEVFVTNGSGDKIHDAAHYPRIAEALPRGRYVFVPAGDAMRERLIGVLGRVFAHAKPGAIPAAVAPHLMNLGTSSSSGGGDD